MKKTNRMIAMALAAAVATTAMPTVAFAEDGGMSDSTNTSAPADTSTPADTSETKSDTTTSTDAAGNTTVTNSTTTTDTNTSSDGVTTESSVTNTESTTTDSGGNVIATASYQSGETITTTPGTGEDAPAVSITMSPAPPAPQAEETVTSSDGTISTTTEVVENNGVTTETEVETVTNPDNTVVTTTETTYTEDADGTQIIETEVSKVTTKGDVPADANDEEYDYSEETESRKVTVEAQQEKIIVFGHGDGFDENGNPIGTTNMTPVQQNWSGTEQGIDWWGSDYMGSVDWNTKEETAAGKEQPDYDVALTGVGEGAEYSIQSLVVEDNSVDPTVEQWKEDRESNTAVLFELSDVQQKMQNVQLKDENGEPVFDENNNPVYVQAKNEDGSLKFDENNNPVYEQEAVYDEEGNAVLEKIGPEHTAYCVDNSTSAKNGYWYDIVNLEDAGYYTEEEATHIRAIVKHGYFGTDDVKAKLQQALNEAAAKGESFALTQEDIDSFASNAEGSMSLDDVKAKLTEANYSTDVINDLTTDDAGSLGAMKTWLKAEAAKEGSTLGLSEADIDAMTEGDMLRVTQMSIWHFGNQAEGEMRFTVADFSQTELDKIYPEHAQRINKLYEYMIGMTDTQKEEEAIGPNKFLKEMTFIVEDKTDESEIRDVNLQGSNSDDNNDNDVYNTAIKFALVVQPGEGDDLTVKVVDQNNNVIASKKIAGEGAEAPDADGSYTISGLQLQENSDINFDLKLEGTQYLEQGVYIYQSEVREGTPEGSQTLVGMMEGTKSVDVQASVEFQFDVQEGTIKQKHSWKKKSVKTPEEDGGGKTTPDPEQKEEPAPDPEIVIDEEEVPLAELPGIVLGEEEPEPMVLGAEEEPMLIAATGDSNHMTAGFGGMFAALAGMFLLRKKKEQ